MTARILLLLAVSAVFATAQTDEPDPVTNAFTLAYDLRVLPRADRTDVTIELRFTVDDGKPTTVGLPKDTEFGTPRLHRFVRDFSGKTGTKVEAGEDPAHRVARPNERGEVHFCYTLSFRPGEFGTATYAPAVGPSYFHLAGAQWMLRVGDATTKRRHVIRLLDLPPRWQAYSTLGSDVTLLDVQASHEALERSAIGAVRGGHHRFTANGGTVNSMIAEKFGNRRDSMTASIEQIIRLQRKAVRRQAGFLLQRRGGSSRR